jgi:nucleoside-diphosphate-sugar epimerase
VVDGQIFNFSDDSRNTNWMIATAFARASGFTGTVEVDLSKGLAHSNKTVFVDYRKASRLLNWYPRHKPMLDEPDIYFQMWKAMNPS